MQEYQFQLDMEAAADTLRTVEKEKSKYVNIQKQNEVVDKWWEEYAQEFTAVDYNEQLEDQIGISVSATEEISFFSASVQPANEDLPTQQSHVEHVNKDLPTQKSHVQPASEVKGKEKGKEISTQEMPKKPRGRQKKTTYTEVKGQEAAHEDAAHEEKSKEIATQEMPKKTRGRPKKTTAAVPSFGRIYYKNRGRSERIANQKKPFVFDKHGTGSTPDKAFYVD